MANSKITGLMFQIFVQDLETQHLHKYAILPFPLHSIRSAKDFAKSLSKKKSFKKTFSYVILSAHLLHDESSETIYMCDFLDGKENSFDGDIKQVKSFENRLYDL